ncbi:MAG: isocitrate dehydrogenase [Planctomycetes bacterium]|nr:isocitrate dehydrogenase [Planctomycetota bacterium]
MTPQLYEIAELLGDGISAELSAAVHNVAAALPFTLRFHQVDLSRARRDAHGAETQYGDAEERIRQFRCAMKYPTETYKESPNAVLRERLNFSVIHRPVASIPGIPTLFKKPVDLHIIRIATGGTYEDAGRRVGTDAAVSVRVIEARPCTEAANYAFQLAQELNCGVVSSSKWTIQRATDGLFEDCVSLVAEKHKHIAYRRELFDSLLAKLVMRPEDFRIIVTPNEYGDFLSDLACGLIGSMGLGDSASFSFTNDGKVENAMFDPAGGTAPDIAGKNICNPAAAFFALSTCLRHLGERRVGDAVKRAALDAIGAGERTRDLNGTLTTSQFTNEVVRRLALLLNSDSPAARD